MGFFDSLFGSKKPRMIDVLVRTKGDLFELFEVAAPTEVQQFRATFLLSVSGMAILNDLGRGTLNSKIDALIVQSKDHIKGKRLPVGQISDDKDVTKRVLSQFPAELNVSLTTVVNGLGAYEAYYFSEAQRLMQDILARSDGPFGCTGYAAIVVADGVFGEGASAEKFMVLPMVMTEFARGLIEAN